MKKVKIAFFMSPIFKEWADGILEELKNHDYEVSSLGFLGGTKSYFESSNKLNFDLGLIYNHDLELEWLTKKPALYEIERYKSLLGDKVIKEIIIADRQLGIGYVSGGLIANSKFSKLINAKNHESQLNYVINLLVYLDNIIKNKEINVFFTYSVAGAFSLACYHICILNKVKFLRLTVPRIGNLYTLDDSPYDTFSTIKENYEARIHTDRYDALYDKAAQYLSSFRNKPVQPGYQLIQNKVYFSKTTLSHQIKVVSKLIFSFFYKKNAYLHNEPFENYKFELALIKRRKQFWKLIDENTTIDIHNIPFHYFPLHVEPEASTMVVSPWHTDQLNTIESISKAIAIDEYLVVKEHLTCIGKRPIGFYERIKRLPNVIFISPTYNSLELIKLSKSTISITGTATWEAFLLNKPAILTGKFLFPFINKGFLKVSSVNTIYDELYNLNSIIYPTDDEIIHLIAAIYENSFEFDSQLLWYSGGTKKVVSENHEIVKNIVKGIIKAIDKE